VDAACGRYLDRLGLDPEPPSLDALARLHRAHVERVPWETLWIQCGERWGIDPVGSVDRIAATGRGGYCYHLNGAFGRLLTELGYRVARHQGAVHGPEGPTAAELGNHLVLTVSGLPTDEHPEGRWYVDVALGDALHEPLPLAAGRYPSGPFAFTVSEVSDGIGEWHLDHHDAGAFTGMAWSQAPAGMAEFGAHHRRLATDPDSTFVRFLVMSRRDARGADLLRGLGYQRAGEPATRRTVASEGELFDLIGDVFGVDVATIPPPVRRDVWQRADAAHRAWLDARAAHGT
jgi:arylamine N-acetyltransferase